MRGDSPHDTALFISSEPPFSTLSPKELGDILERFTEAAGCPATARSFRTSGASRAVAAGKGDVAFKIGRWRHHDVFWRHYVSVNIPADYADVFWDFE